MFTHIDGIQIGEYFGASLLSVNLNNDQFSDLIIGAPFYSSKESGDCGRVYIYLSNGNVNSIELQLWQYFTNSITNIIQGFDLPIILNGFDSNNARFGTALADLGDLNFDGYNGIILFILE